MSVRTAIGLGACMLAIACTQPGDLGPEAAQAPPAMRHAVQSERMRELMASLHRLERGRLPQAMDVGLERQRRIEDIARTARDLAAAAATLAELASELEHTEADREAFIGFARALERDSASLAEDAPTLSSAAVRARARAIRADCERCHARFRPDSIGSPP